MMEETYQRRPSCMPLRCVQGEATEKEIIHILEKSAGF
jgi:hypothetical protein